MPALRSPGRTKRRPERELGAGPRRRMAVELIGEGTLPLAVQEGNTRIRLKPTVPGIRSSEVTIAAQCQLAPANRPRTTTEPRADRDPPGRRDRASLHRRRPLHRARPGARRHAPQALPGRPARGARGRDGPRAHDDAEGLRGRARPGRRQGRDDRRRPRRPARRAPGPGRERDRRARRAPTSPPRTSAPPRRTWTTWRASRATAWAARWPTAAAATPRPSPPRPSSRPSAAA